MRVKRFVVLLLISSLLLLAMVGCSGDSVQAKQLYLDAVDALAQANSYAYDMTLDQVLRFPEPIPIGFGEETDTMTTQIRLTGRCIEDPLAMVMTLKASMPDFMDLEDLAGLQAYMVDNKMYLYLDMFGEWWSYDEEFVEDAMAEVEEVAGSSSDPMYFINTLDEDDVANASVKEDKGYYTLIITVADGALADSIIDEMMDQVALELNEEETEAVLEGIEFSNFKYEMRIEKETDLPTNVSLDFTLTITVEGETLEIVQGAEMIYSEFGAFDSIEVPEEIKEIATPIQ
ncbi:MAG TPA: DUF6612 family protein [Cyclobacteriaceae bacterium]|nr:DUF6612 family protein [Cyclobacteriaceae bacterium]